MKSARIDEDNPNRSLVTRTGKIITIIIIEIKSPQRQKKLGPDDTPDKRQVLHR